MLAQLHTLETGRERIGVPHRFRGKTYLRFDAVPGSRPATTHADIARPPAPLEPGSAREREAVPQASGLMATLKLWRARITERRQMARDLDGFTDEMLNDLGLTRRAARAIAHAPFWRPIT